ncbi:MAG: protein-L-isoaspartate(D-aspartate) O-methyltransferase [Gammaproteobacteria bacterium]|jgi:protein-L-isoaspartate(D-aspartate) O-methyltransferase
MKKNVQRLLDEIESEVRYTRNLIGKNELDPRVMDAMARVPRDEFVPPDLRAMAFDDGPLPIGHGQTISQPYIVALMTDLLQLEQDHSVLEIGTGSGYQTAILSQLCKQVYTMELVLELSEAAAVRLKKLGYSNIECRAGSGYSGWPEHAPYDGIIVTAAAARIPEALIEQLKPAGRLVIPVGMPYSHQELMLVEKNDEGDIHVKDILGVAFVPLVNDTDGQ